MKQREHDARERERIRVLGCVRECLVDLLPAGTRVWIYGSLTRPGRFHDASDLDLALEDDDGRFNLVHLMNELSRRTGRSVDLCRLSETRLAAAIQREGERWTL